eukprot:141077-Alexandrium_andersonii.AAC.1
MSASLVGSEMCIRDRSVLSSSIHVHASHTCACGVMLGLLAVGAVPYAVSYTHLTLPTICSV